LGRAELAEEKRMLQRSQFKIENPIPAARKINKNPPFLC